MTWWSRGRCKSRRLPDSGGYDRNGDAPNLDPASPVARESQAERDDEECLSAY